jgi:TFIIF-interacting CTD phosphatase-like protein
MANRVMLHAVQQIRLLEQTTLTDDPQELKKIIGKLLQLFKTVIWEFSTIFGEHYE